MRSFIAVIGIHLLGMLLLGTLLLDMAHAAAETSPPSGALRIAVYTVPPYGTVTADGSISGLSVDLWRRVAERIHRQFEFTPVDDMAALLHGVKDGRFDAAIGAITITEEREKLVDFSYPAHRSGVAVATRKRTGPLVALHDYTSALAELGPLVLVIVGSLMVTGFAMWIIERSGGAFGHESHVATLRDGMYWAIVTMTTVGYGDKTPKTNWGRIVATVWMFGSLILISLLSTSLVSRLTADRVESGDSAAAIDLTAQKLAAVADSSGAEYLDAQRLPYAKKKDLAAALDSLVAGDATAVVNSIGALRYAVVTSHANDVDVARDLLAPAYMAIALPRQSPLETPINEALIKITGGPEWTRTEDRFFRR